MIFEAWNTGSIAADFVVQGGDPRGDGWGGPGWTIRSEWSRLSYERGTVGIAHSGKDTGGSQYFITLTPTPHLDGGYTIFYMGVNVGAALAPAGLAFERDAMAGGAVLPV